MTDQHLAVEAERMVLSAMMHGAAEEAARHLTSGDFYEYRHAGLYDHLLELWGAGEPTTPVALLKRLADQGELTRSTVATYLHSLFEMDGSPLQVGYYAKIVLEAAEQRRYAVIAVELGHAAEKLTGEALRAKTAQILERTNAERVPDSSDSWTPLDLGPYLRGEVVRPQPSVGAARLDGIHFLYPGKEHGVIGEMEAGKSWFALACVAAELNRGNTVVYVHFEEVDPSDSIERLLVQGVSPGAIEKLFRFVAPAQAMTDQRISRLLDPVPSLVVLDGVNEGMSLHGQAIREEDGAATFRRRLVKPFTAVGSAVLSADHVVKDVEKRGRYALGSIHKGNALNGSLILLENADPFGRGERGRSHLYVTKDRPGHLRRHGRATKVPGKTYMGELIVDDRQLLSPDLELLITAPAAGNTSSPTTELTDDDRVIAVVVDVVAKAGEANVRTVRAAAGVAKDRVDNAIERLKLAGRLIETAGPRRARLFTVAQDQSPDGGL